MKLYINHQTIKLISTHSKWLYIQIYIQFPNQLEVVLTHAT